MKNSRILAAFAVLAVCAFVAIVPATVDAALPLWAAPPAWAAENASDYILEIDRDGAGVVKRRLILAEHHTIDTASWSSQRSAAATSLASWLSWLQTNDAAGYTWVTGKTSTEQEGLRQALLTGS